TTADAIGDSDLSIVTPWTVRSCASFLESLESDCRFAKVEPGANGTVAVNKAITKPRTHHRALAVISFFLLPQLPTESSHFLRLGHPAHQPGGSVQPIPWPLPIAHIVIPAEPERRTRLANS